MRVVATSSTRLPPLCRAIAVLIILLLVSLPAVAVIIDSGDGTGNTTAPLDDPGFANVGLASGLTAVYLRNGWILTAAHVGIGNVNLGGIVYTSVPGSDIQLDDGMGTLADLIVFAITPTPPLPDLEIRTNTSLPIGEVIMIGKGIGRGAASDTDDPGIWTSPPPNPVPAVEGWYWSGNGVIRWGTNTVEGEWLFTPVDTKSFYTIFDKVGATNHTIHEAQVANGDSGGALFAKDGSDWELAGILWALAGFEGQNQSTSALRGNASLAADLSFYADDINTLTATPLPEPATALQLVTGSAVLAWLKRRRSR